MKENCLLSQLCETRFGANTSVGAVGDFPCLQSRNFSDSGEFLKNEIQLAPKDALTKTEQLQTGQILFSSKGRIFASYWNNQVPDVIASGSFLIMTVISNRVLPEYLVIYLNSKKAKRYFELNMKMGTVPHIGKKDIELLPIELPDLDKQRALIQLNALISEEFKICNEIKKKMDNIINQII